MVRRASLARLATGAPQLTLPRWLADELTSELDEVLTLERLNPRGLHDLAFDVSQALGALFEKALGARFFTQLTGQLGDPVDESGPFVRRIERALYGAYPPVNPEGESLILERGLLDEIDVRWLRNAVLHALNATFAGPSWAPVPVTLRGGLQAALGGAMRSARATPRAMATALLEALERFATEHRQDALLANIAHGREQKPTFRAALARRLAQIGFRKRATVAEWRALGAVELVQDRLNERAVVESPTPICVLNDGDLQAVEEALAQIYGIAWTEGDPAAAPRGAPGDDAAASARAYLPTERFAPGEAIRHPRFGLGVVTERIATTISVQFTDGPRKLRHAG